jgi:ribosomal protein S18 acetylase RimI-like enzyme
MLGRMIRALTPADTDAFIALRRRGLAEAPYGFGASLEDDFTNDVEAVQRSLARWPDAVTYGALVGDDLVGIVSVVRETKIKMRHKASIYGVYVAPEARRHGLARQLLQTAIDHARAEGVHVVQLTVADDASEARRVYERVGFVRWGTEPDALFIEGRFVDDHHMVLRMP